MSRSTGTPICFIHVELNPDQHLDVRTCVLKDLMTRRHTTFPVHAVNARLKLPIHFNLVGLLKACICLATLVCCRSISYLCFIISGYFPVEFQDKFEVCQCCRLLIWSQALCVHLLRDDHLMFWFARVCFASANSQISVLWIYCHNLPPGLIFLIMRARDVSMGGRS